MPEALRIRGEADGPSAYATRLSTYLTDAKYIHAMTVREYGKAPAVANIQRQIDKHRKSKEAFAQERFLGGAHYIPENDNGEHFRVRGLVEPEPKERPKIVRREPVKRCPPYEAQEAHRQKHAARFAEAVAPSKAIIAAVADWFGTTPKAICSHSRRSFLVSARFVAVKLMHETRFSDGSRRYSYPMIGKALGGRDHSTIVYNVATFDDRAKKFPEMLEAYEALKDG